MSHAVDFRDDVRRIQRTKTEFPNGRTAGRDTDERPVVSDKDKMQTANAVTEIYDRQDVTKDVKKENNPDDQRPEVQDPNIVPGSDVKNMDVKTVTKRQNKKEDGQVEKTKGHEPVQSDDVLPVLVLSCDRTSVKRCLDLLIKSVAMMCVCLHEYSVFWRAFAM